VQVGFLGFPGAGKSTLFTALEGRDRASSGRGGDTQRVVVRVPDARVDHLSTIFSPRKTTHAEILFVLPGAAADSPQTALPESALTSIGPADALVLVVRAFDVPDVPREAGSRSIAEDLQRLEDEMMLRDLERIETRLQRLLKEGKKAESAAERILLEKLRATLEAENPLRELEWSEDQLARMRGFQFLSLKPVLVVANVGEDDLAALPPLPEARPNREVLALSARIEREVAELPAAEQPEFLAHLGLEATARDVFVRSAFRLLDLISFFTVGEDEVRAWPVRRGSIAPVAAGKIHTDLQKGFIRAEVIHYDDFVRVGSLAAARSQGLLRLEGKQYVVQDGDIMHVRHA